MKRDGFVFSVAFCLTYNPPYLPPTKIKDGKMARFGFHAASSLIWGGWGFAVLFYSVQDCRSAT